MEELEGQCPPRTGQQRIGQTLQDPGSQRDGEETPRSPPRQQVRGSAQTGTSLIVPTSNAMPISVLLAPNASIYSIR